MRSRLFAGALVLTLTLGFAPTAFAAPGNLGAIWPSVSNLIADLQRPIGAPPADVQGLLRGLVPPPAFPLGIPVGVTTGVFSPLFGALAGPGSTSALAPLPGLGDLPELPF